MGGKKVIHFSKCMLRHSLLRANSFKAEDSAGFWRPDSPGLGITRAKKASFPDMGLANWSPHSFPLVTSHCFRTLRGRRVSSPMARLCRREGKGLSCDVGPHMRLEQPAGRELDSEQPGREGMEYHLPTLWYGVCAGDLGRVLIS